MRKHSRDSEVKVPMKSRFGLLAALGVLLGTGAGVTWATANWMAREEPMPTTLRTEADKQQSKPPESAIGGGPLSVTYSNPPQTRLISSGQ